MLCRGGLSVVTGGERPVTWDTRRAQRERHRDSATATVPPRQCRSCALPSLTATARPQTLCAWRRHADTPSLPPGLKLPI